MTEIEIQEGVVNDLKCQLEAKEAEIDTLEKTLNRMRGDRDRIAMHLYTERTLLFDLQDVE